MKQALTIMAVITAALLLVSGVIVVGSMEQSNQINSQRAQLGELRQRLQEANARLDEQASSAELLSASLAAVRKERDEALDALSEAELAVTGSSQALGDALDAHEAKRADLNATIAELTLRADALNDELQAVIGKHNAALVKNDELEDLLLRAEEAKAASDESARAAATERDELRSRLSALENETRDFAALLALWNEARIGLVDVTQLQEALIAFEANYPQSGLRLPEGKTQPDDDESIELSEPTPTAGIEPTLAPAQAD